ncbi:MAG TPA: alpha/beta hydrolase [Candidatus Limnocylindria bacterium]|nr:alpha/beta hydrolase [Candidatus Limnocylindria bacterium]
MDFTTVTLSDGRVVDVLAGAPGPTKAVLFHHGTPGNSPRYQSWFAEIESRGLRPVAYSRPGYATSTRHPGRTVASAVADSAELLDQLGINDFYSLGGSGGGPHSIACAALLPSRCLGAAALVTIAPWKAPGLDFFADMAQVNLDEFGAADAGEWELRELLAVEAEPFRHVTGPEMIGAMGDSIPAVDQKVATGEWAEQEAFGLRRALSEGVDGWVDDDLAFVQPWGFDLGSIRVPVHIWQGELDRLVPWAHGQWLASQIPGARFNLAPGEGHFSLGVANRDQILDDLLGV